MDSRGQTHVSAALPPVPNRRFGGPQSWSEHFGEEINLLPLLGFEPWIL